MKAEIFYLKGDEDRRKHIERTLRREVFDHIDVDHVAIQNDYGTVNAPTEVDKILRVYLDRLRASMIRVTDFRIVISDSSGYWCYMGYEGGRSRDPEVGKFIRISYKGFCSLFPAVAIMDRMVMAPQGIHEILKASSEVSWMLRPLDLHGLSLVNFEQRDFIEDEIRKVASQMRNETTKLCARYVQARRLQSPDFDELSILLGVDEAYLRMHQSHIKASRIKLNTKVLSEPLRIGKLSTVVLQITDESENMLGRVRVQVRGPKGALVRDPVAEILHFTNDDMRSQQIQIGVRPLAVPYCPLEVLFVPDPASEVHISYPVPVILDVLS
ncbi:hypothetical protein [Amycolatopsis sp. NPDC051061]|uniref:hypothetical protein n=1 Tax=Amycolatopsis sp. NPDC051061 TaxID=3155042 RepID=UPI00342A5604